MVCVTTAVSVYCEVGNEFSFDNLTLRNFVKIAYLEPKLKGVTCACYYGVIQ